MAGASGEARLPGLSTFNAFDIDARGDDVVFAGPATGEDSVIRRLDPSTKEAPEVSPTAPKFSGLDMGLDGGGHPQLVYSRCDESDTACDIYRKPFSGSEQLIPASTEQCRELRPSMWNGLVLFDRTGEGCAHELFLAPLRGGSETKVTGATGGADLSDGTAAWLSGGGLTASTVSRTGEFSEAGRLEPAEDETLRAPLVVENDYVYFVHEQGGQFFIARAELPLDGSEIEHYVASEDGDGSEVSPHFGFTGKTLYTRTIRGRTAVRAAT